MKMKDSCPEWADTMLDQLLQLEIYLGNIPKDLQWESKFVKDVSKRIFPEDFAILDDSKTELVFNRIIEGLHKEHFTAQQMVEFINARVGYKGGPPYCNLEEVEMAIKCQK